MAGLRGATLPAEMAGYASALQGFPMAAIESVCMQLENSEIADYEPRFPELGKMLRMCREAQQAQNPVQRKFYCPDCESECGMLFFDAPAGGHRLRGRALVTAPNRYARPCPCGGTLTDWRSFDQAVRGRPENFHRLVGGNNARAL